MTLKLGSWHYDLSKWSLLTGDRAIFVILNLFCEGLKFMEVGSGDTIEINHSCIKYYDCILNISRSMDPIATRTFWLHFSWNSVRTRHWLMACGIIGSKLWIGLLAGGFREKTYVHPEYWGRWTHFWQVFVPTGLKPPTSWGSRFGASFVTFRCFWRIQDGRAHGKNAFHWCRIGNWTYVLCFHLFFNSVFC